MTNPTEQQINERLAKFDGWTFEDRFAEGTADPCVMMFRPDHGWRPVGFIDYMHSPADALRVAEKICKQERGTDREYWFSLDNNSNTWSACFQESAEGYVMYGWGETDTPAAAIALAVYRVLEEENHSTT